LDLKQAFGAQVRNYRKARGLGQGFLAEKTQLSTVTISKIERGKAAPSFATAERIAAALEVSPLALFGTEPPAGERGRLIGNINVALSRLNDAQLAQAARLLEAMRGELNALR
jgi:transcriptional regulator with XRE-family HTH domain